MSYVGIIGSDIVVRRLGDIVRVDVRGPDGWYSIDCPPRDVPTLCRHALNVAAEIQHSPQEATSHRSLFQERMAYWRRVLRFPGLR